MVAAEEWEGGDGRKSRTREGGRRRVRRRHPEGEMLREGSKRGTDEEGVTGEAKKPRKEHNTNKERKKEKKTTMHVGQTE